MKPKFVQWFDKKFTKSLRRVTKARQVSSMSKVLQIEGLVYRIFQYLDIKTMVLCRGVCLDWLYKGYNSNSLTQFSNTCRYGTILYDTETIFLLKDIIQFYRVEQIQLILWPISMNCIMSDLKYFGKLKNVFIGETHGNEKINKNKNYCNFIIGEMLSESCNTIQVLDISADCSTVTSLQMLHEITQHRACNHDCNNNNKCDVRNNNRATSNICTCSNATKRVIFPNLKQLFLGGSEMNYIQFGECLQLLEVSDLQIDLKFWFYLSESILYNLKKFNLDEVQEAYSEQTMPSVIKLARKVAKKMSHQVEDVMYTTEGTEGGSSKSPKLHFISALSEKGTIKWLDINIFADPIDLNSLSLTKTYQFVRINNLELTIDTCDNEDGCKFGEINLADIVSNMIVSDKRDICENTSNIHVQDLDLCFHCKKMKYMLQCFHKLNQSQFGMSDLRCLSVSCMSDANGKHELSKSGITQILQEICNFLDHLGKLDKKSVSSSLDNVRISLDVFGAAPFNYSNHIETNENDKGEHFVQHQRMAVHTITETIKKIAGFSHIKRLLRVSVKYRLDFSLSDAALLGEQEVMLGLLSIFGLKTAQQISPENSQVSKLKYAQMVNGIKVEVGCTSSLRAWLTFTFKAKKK